VSTLEAEQTKLTPLGQALFHKLFDELSRLEAELAFYQEQLESLAHTHPVCQRLLTMPGIGPLTATALIAAVGDAQVFKNGRQFAAWVGLVPKQYSPGCWGSANEGIATCATPHSRHAGDPTLGEDKSRSAEPLDTEATGAPRVESDGRGGGEQECTDRLGLTEPGWSVSRVCKRTPQATMTG
jgi:hypothetical protein